MPVFALLLLNYLYFGLEIPTEVPVYLFFGFLTVLSGFVANFYLRDEVDAIWAIESGLFRWLFIAVAFTAKGVLESFSSIEVIGEFSQIITLQFLWELPAMIAGYLIGLKIYELLRGRLL